MSQPSNNDEFSLDFVYEGQPWCTRVVNFTGNLQSMDYVYMGEPFVTWNPDSNRTTIQFLYPIWG